MSPFDSREIEAGALLASSPSSSSEDVVIFPAEPLVPSDGNGEQGCLTRRSAALRMIALPGAAAAATVAMTSGIDPALAAKAEIDKSVSSSRPKQP